ncbi:MAG TPA: winged helix-turn-helix domain-containing protein [Scandinavium sp.]|jgi:hypothetical protein
MTPDIINGDIYKYFGVEEALSEASHITNIKTGERVEFDNDAKLLYSRMRKRYHFFTMSSTGGNKGIYHDNVEELKDSVNISKSTALRYLKDLKQVGLVASTLSGRSNQWLVVDITPDCFLLERNAGTKAKPEWVDCLKNPVFGKAKEENSKPEPEEVKADPMCDLDESPEEEAPAAPPPKLKRQKKHVATSTTPAPRYFPTEKPIKPESMRLNIAQLNAATVNGDEWDRYYYAVVEQTIIDGKTHHITPESMAIYDSKIKTLH